MGLSDFMAQTEAQSNIVTFGRDRQVASPLTINITENGEYNVALYAKAVVDVQGGTGSNHKETVTGTCDSLALPEGFADLMATGDASAIVTINLGLLDPEMGDTPIVLQALGNSAFATLGQIGEDAATSTVFSIIWNIEPGESYGAVDYARALMGGNVQDVTMMASFVPYSLALYYHTMPEEAEPEEP